MNADTEVQFKNFSKGLRRAESPGLADRAREEKSWRKRGLSSSHEENSDRKRKTQKGVLLGGTKERKEKEITGMVTEAGVNRGRMSEGTMEEAKERKSKRKLQGTKTRKSAVWGYPKIKGNVAQTG